jgi:hypothetical protein
MVLIEAAPGRVRASAGLADYTITSHMARDQDA